MDTYKSKFRLQVIPFCQHAFLTRFTSFIVVIFPISFLSHWRAINAFAHLQFLCDFPIIVQNKININKKSKVLRWPSTVI